MSTTPKTPSKKRPDQYEKPPQAGGKRAPDPYRPEDPPCHEPPPEPRTPPPEPRTPPPEPVPCTITILASPKQRSFSPPDGVTGKESFSARLSRALGDEETIRWSQVLVPGSGSVEFDSPSSPTTVVRARRPNRVIVVVQVLGPAGNVVCEDRKPVSVPQFFRVRPFQGYFSALADLGLQTGFTLADPNADAKVALDNRIRRESISAAIRSARSRFRGINVRFVTKDPSFAIGLKNFTTVRLTGLSPRRDLLGEMRPPVLDVGNLRPNDTVFVYAQEVSNPLGVLGESMGVFDGLIVRKQFSFFGQTMEAAVENSQPVRPGEFVADRTKVTTVRQLKVNSAFFAFTRFVGSVMAHECGHALGLVAPVGGTSHNAAANGNLMDDGKTLDFTEDTGILRYGKKLGTLTWIRPVRLSEANRKSLQAILPILDR